jgi:hypothetical protein
MPSPQHINQQYRLRRRASGHNFPLLFVVAAPLTTSKTLRATRAARLHWTRRLDVECH